MSARCSVAIGPGRSRVRSRTRIPESGFARIYSTVFGKGCPSIQLVIPALVIFLRVLDRLAVVRQPAGPSERNVAAQLGDAADAVFYRLRESCRRYTAQAIEDSTRSITTLRGDVAFRGPG